MNKAGIALITLLLILFFCPVISAYSIWTQYGITPRGQNNATDNYNVMFSQPEGLTGEDSFISNCTFNGYASHGAYVDSIYHYVWLIKGTTLELDDSNCNVLDEINLGGPSESSGAILNWDDDDYPNLIIPVWTTATTANLTSFEWNGTDLVKDKSVGVIKAMGYPISGLVCDIANNLCGLWSVTTFQFFNMTNFARTDVSSGSYSYLPVIGTALSARHGATGADIDGDSHIEAIWIASSGTSYVRAFEVDLTTRTLDRMTTISPSYNSQDAPIATCYYGQIGGSASMPEILCSGWLSDGNGDFVDYRIYDSNWAIKLDLSYIQNTSLRSGWGLKSGNWMVGDYNKDDQNEYCVVYSTGYPANDSQLRCYSGTHALLSSCNLTSGYGQNNLSVWTMYPTSSGIRFVSALGMFDQSCTKIMDFGLSDIGVYNGQFIQADVNNDMITDLIYSDEHTALLFMAYPPETSVVCDSIVPPVYSKDTFSFYSDIGLCGWQKFPNVLILPTEGKICIDGSTQDIFKQLNYQGETHSSEYWTEDFDLNLTQGANFEKRFSFYPATGSFGEDYAYILSWFQTGGQTFIQYFTNISNTTSLESLCTDCYAVDTETHYRIHIYGPGALGYTILNSTSHQFQVEQPNTIAIEIDGIIAGFNIPIAHNAIYALLPKYTYFTTQGNQSCLDNYILTNAVSGTSEINATVPTRQLGQPCTDNSQCFTGKCLYGKCMQKEESESCLNDYECISENCVDGLVCSKASLWQSLEGTKKELAGDDVNTNNLLAIILSVSLGGLIAMIAARAGSVALGGIGAIFGIMIGFIFFTMVGWLSPFILIGLVIVAVLGIVMLIVFGSRG